MRSLLLALVFITMSSAIVPQPSKASDADFSISALQGRTVLTSDQSCMSDGYGQVTNTCTRTVNFDIPLPVNTNSTDPIDVEVWGTSGAGGVIKCTVTSVGIDGTMFNSSTQAIGGTWATTSFDNIPYKLWGTVYVNCKIPQGGTLSEVAVIYP